MVIEDRSPGYVRYRRLHDGRRWEVYGICDRRGNCLIGSVIGGEVVRDKEHLAELTARLGHRPDTPLDVPVTPELRDCCPFTYVELERGH